MKTLKERLQDLKDKFEKRQKQVDNILETTTRIGENMKDVMENTNNLIDDLQKTVKKTNDTIDMLTKDYKDLKNDMKKIKNNFWFKLFRVK